ncbi:hypothetical protein [Clostridium sp. SHJSY1]|uniref:hypothetical protein n=1 Tax=Clostridium sp. SHJSY1 TaxID=2942483 RepID=UPI00287BB679|nr:hypothetical protein [Clostridium sp. SHJSY1]
MCYKCKQEVTEEEKFIAFYGEILCSECSKGVEPCTSMFRLLLDIPNDLSEVYYYFHKTDLTIKAQLTSVEHSREDIYIQFTTGSIVISDMSKIRKVKKPIHNTGTFEFCYMIKNSDNEVIGYIGKQNDK